MVASTLTQQQGRGWFDILDDWLKHDRFVFVGLVWITSFSHCLSRNWWAGLLALCLSQVGTLTDLQVVTLRVLISLQRLCQRLLMLWVILFFYFGVLKAQGDFIRWCQLGGLWAFCCSPRCICTYRFHAQTV